MDSNDVGYAQGERCGRNGCAGVIEEGIRGGCYCHTLAMPPCGSCTEEVGYCPTCGWRARDEK